MKGIAATPPCGYADARIFANMAADTTRRQARSDVNDLHNRRAFLRAAVAAGAAWAAADLVQVEDALAWAGQQAATHGAGAAPAAAGALTKAQADVMEAMLSRIIPSVDGRPGAREAGAVYFVDRALATFNASQKKLFTDGIADLNRRATAKSPAAGGFAALIPAQQDEVLRDIEKTPFFESARQGVIRAQLIIDAWRDRRVHEWRNQRRRDMADGERVGIHVECVRNGIVLNVAALKIEEEGRSAVYRAPDIASEIAIGIIGFVLRKRVPRIE